MSFSETQVPSLGQEDPLAKEMATHSSISFLEIPWTEDSGGLPHMWSPELGMTERVNHHHKVMWPLLYILPDTFNNQKKPSVSLPLG